MRELQVVWAGSVPYGAASGWQRALYERRLAGEIADTLLLLEHPHVYTLGRRFRAEHLLFTHEKCAELGIEVCECDRGGSVTYHGPGQLVGYPIVDFRSGEDRSAPAPDAIRYLRTLEEAVIRTVRRFGVIAGRRESLTGVWVGPAKLASIGVNLSRGVSRHGFALNVSCDLSFFDGIVACGISGLQVASLESLTGTAPGLEEAGDAVARRLAQLLHRRCVSRSPAAAGLAPDAPLDGVVPFRRPAPALPGPSAGSRRGGASGGGG